MNVRAWGEHRARYSRARHGRNDRGASLFECALLQSTAQALQLRESLAARATPAAGAPAPTVEATAA